ncbi:MAG: Holliday junction resolvase RuvX [Nakamurella sp.]
MTQTSEGDAPPRGVRLGVDVGTVRVGVAVCDPDGILATPVVTLARDTETAADIDQLVTLVTERCVVEVVVGLPRTLRGRDGTSALDARHYAADLQLRIDPIPVVLVDERMTSVQANRILTERRVPGRSRRAVVDQIAAVEILQSRLDELRVKRASCG